MDITSTAARTLTRTALFMHKYQIVISIIHYKVFGNNFPVHRLGIIDVIVHFVFAYYIVELF